MPDNQRLPRRSADVPQTLQRRFFAYGDVSAAIPDECFDAGWLGVGGGHYS